MKNVLMNPTKTQEIAHANYDLSLSNPQYIIYLCLFLMYTHTLQYDYSTHCSMNTEQS